MHLNCRILYTGLYTTDSNSLNFNYIFGNFGLYWGVLEGQNMSAIWDEETLYQNLKKKNILPWCSPGPGSVASSASAASWVY